MTLTFGKYSGYDLRSVPDQYLRWLSSSMTETLAAIETEVKRRELDEEENSTMEERIIKFGYRELSKRMHPDHGGDHEAMVELNAAYQSLMEGRE